MPAEIKLCKASVIHLPMSVHDVTLHTLLSPDPHVRDAGASLDGVSVADGWRAKPLTILGAALCAVLGMLALNRLPMPHHPVFNVPRFALASRDRFFLCIEATDEAFDGARTRQFLAGLNPVEVSDIDS